MNILIFFGYCFLTEIAIITIVIISSLVGVSLKKKEAQSTYKHLLKLENDMKNNQEEFLEKLLEENPELYKTLAERLKKKAESNQVRDSVLSNSVPQEELEKVLEKAVE